MTSEQENLQGGKLLRRLTSKDQSFTVLDQALVSSTNFVTTVLVARYSSVRELGLFALCFTSLAILANIQRALFVEPHNVLGVRRETHVAKYTTSTTMAAAAFSIVGAVLGALGGVVAYVLGYNDAGDLVFVTSGVAIFYLLQDYLRGILFTLFRVSSVLSNDVVCYGGQIAAIVAIAIAGELSAKTAVIAMGATSAAAAALGIAQIRDQLVSGVAVRYAAAQNWEFGRWLVVSTAAEATAGRLYVYLASSLISVAGAGALRAVQTIMGVTNILTFSLIGRALPRASKVYDEGGHPALSQCLRHLTVRVAIPVWGYVAVMLVIPATVLEIAFGEGYREYAILLQLTALNTAVWVPASILTMGIKAKRISTPFAPMSGFSALYTIIAGPPILIHYGLNGAAASALGLACMSLGYFTYHYRRTAQVASR